MLLRTIMARRLGALNDSSVRAHRFGERRAHSSQLGLQRLRLGGGLKGNKPDMRRKPKASVRLLALRSVAHAVRNGLMGRSATRCCTCV